jgi:hypothetical protein
VRFQAH